MFFILLSSQATALIDYHIFCRLSTTFLFFFIASFQRLSVCLSDEDYLIILICNCQRFYCFLFISFLVAYALLLRVGVGGLGLRIIAQFFVEILVVWLAISINKQYFWERYVKTVVFLASISLILWFLSVLQINIWDQITPEVDSLMSYRIYSDSSTYKEIAYKLHGMFLYSHRTIDMRNVSIFTEPGIYQMVLNTAIFVLLFFRDKLVSFSDKKVGHALMILSCALLSTQSTTGYISICFIVLFYMLFEKKENTGQNWKQKICIVLFAMLLFLMIDYMVRGNESFIQISVISKLFSGGKKVSLDESGMARADVIFLVWDIRGLARL